MPLVALFAQHTVWCIAVWSLGEDARRLGQGARRLGDDGRRLGEGGRR
jgi:hypothetical protein